MFPAKFDYAAPTTLDGALALLANRDDEARVLAGGQSLIPLLKLRFAVPALLIDLNRIPGLDGFSVQDDALLVGALARHSAIARSQLAARHVPLLAHTAAQIADPLVRNLGTLGGSLAHADPRGDWAAALIALGADLVLRSSGGQRVVSIYEFERGPFETALQPGEILERVRIPVPAGPASGRYLKLERKVGDFATVGVAVQVELDGERIARAGIGLTAVGSDGRRAEVAEAALAGGEPTESLFAEAARLAAEECQPVDDVRGSAAYKRHVVEVFVRRGLAEAVAQAQEEWR